MAVKAKLTADEHAALDAALKGLYKQGTDGFILDAEGVEDVSGLKKVLADKKADVDKLRTTIKELEDKAKAFEGFDLDEVRQLVEDKRKAGDKKLLDEGKVEELIASRLAPVNKEREREKAAFQQAISAKDTEIAKLTTRLEEVLIDTGLTEAAGKVGVKPSALRDVLLRGRLVWKLKDGKPTPVRDDGEGFLTGKDPLRPISMEEWVQGLQPDAPHLFEPNSGARSEPGGARSGGGNRIVLTRDQARDVRTWRNAQDQAAKNGAEVVVEG